MNLDLELNQLMGTAYAMGVDAAEDLENSAGDPEAMMKAAKAFGIACGRLDFMECVHEKESAEWREVCDLSTRLRLRWAEAERAVARAGRRVPRAASTRSRARRKVSQGRQRGGK